jgi:oligopeptide/dipeptide ABC transporter ATP-binding protein
MQVWFSFAEKTSRSAAINWFDYIAPPPGCRFHTGCPYAKGVCSEREPRLLEVRKNHFAACHFTEEISATQA